MRLKNIERDKTIYHEWVTGSKRGDIAKKYGLSAVWVGEICKRQRPTESELKKLIWSMRVHGHSYEDISSKHYINKDKIQSICSELKHKIDAIKYNIENCLCGGEIDWRSRYINTHDKSDPHHSGICTFCQTLYYERYPYIMVKNKEKCKCGHDIRWVDQSESKPRSLARISEGYCVKCRLSYFKPLW